MALDELQVAHWHFQSGFKCSSKRETQIKRHCHNLGEVDRYRFALKCLQLIKNQKRLRVRCFHFFLFFSFASWLMSCCEKPNRKKLAQSSGSAFDVMTKGTQMSGDYTSLYWTSIDRCFLLELHLRLEGFGASSRWWRQFLLQFRCIINNHARVIRIGPSAWRSGARSDDQIMNWDLAEQQKAINHRRWRFHAFLTLLTSRFCFAFYFSRINLQN